MRHAPARFGALPALVCGVLLLAGTQSPVAAQATLLPEIEAFIEEMAQKHQFHRASLRRIFSQVRPRPAIIRAMTAPRTARPWHEFRLAYITPSRIEGGVRFWQEHAATLARASGEYGVPEELIVATIGVETLYGRNTGSFRVLDALATLAFQYPPRAEFFRTELEEYLLLTREAGFDPLALKGSYAGAMGLPQFLPSSYRKYAVDFNGDGKRDLLETPADAIGSVANYYHSFGWRKGEVTAVPADPGATAVDAAAGIKPEMKVAELRKKGIVPLAAVSDEAEAVLFVVETESGPRHFLGLNNFYVITRYNRSVNYAMAVLELSRELRAAMGK
jgi:peptidoglycan lytic transglycosylase B